MEKTALFIGRFQPPHLGHLDAIKQIYSTGVSKILIGIGSANKEGTKDNPFSYNERKSMIEIFLKENGLDVSDIKPIPDFDDDEVWKKHILQKFGNFDYIASGNPWVREIFEKAGMKTIDFDVKVPIRASNLRNQIFLNRQGLLSQALSPDILDYLNKINAHEKFKKIYKHEMVSPSIAVDGICRTPSGKYVFIERKNPPYGIAIPGGFVDYGESLEDAVRREMSEELRVPEDMIIVKKQIGAFGDPDRDPRGHVISVAFEIQLLTEDVVASDDAKEIVKVDPSDISDLKLVFDHNKIIGKLFAGNVGI